MIDIASENTVEEEGVQGPRVATGEEEAPTDAQDSVYASAFEPCPRDPLEWYLMKLLAPIEDAPRELVPRWGRDEAMDETPASVPELPQPVRADDREPRRAAEAPKEVKPLWQNTGPSVAAAPAAGSIPSTPAEPSPPKPKPKPALRSLTRKEKSGSGRQRLMMALIPVLALVMVFVLKHPLGAHATVAAAARSRMKPPRRRLRMSRLRGKSLRPMKPAAETPCRPHRHRL